MLLRALPTWSYLVGFQPLKLLAKQFVKVAIYPALSIWKLGRKIYALSQTIPVNNIAECRFNVAVCISSIKIVHASVDCFEN